MPGHKLPARPPEDEPSPDEIRDDVLRRRPTLEPCLPPSGERAASGPERRQVLQHLDDFTFQWSTLRDN